MSSNVVDLAAYRAERARVGTTAIGWSINQYEDGRVKCVLSYPDRNECIYEGDSLLDAADLVRGVATV